MTVTTTLRDEYQSLLETAAKEDGGSTVADIETKNMAAITSSDTLLVIDMQIDFLPGGSFGVAEGDQTVDGICDLITKFHAAGATVLATREYHPKNHCSFLTMGGPFPAHCIQGTRGSYLHEKIASTMQPMLTDEEDKATTTHVVYKGFSKDIDSFGGFQYNQKSNSWKTRLSHTSMCCHGSFLDWTGAYTLYSSTIGEDANAPPDVMSVLDKRPVLELLPVKEADKVGRVFVCGLAYDFCVIDTAANYCDYAKTKIGTDSTDRSCFIVQDLTRAAHIPGLGQFGSGFLTDPKVMLDKLKNGNIGLVRFED